MHACGLHVGGREGGRKAGRPEAGGPPRRSLPGAPRQARVACGRAILGLGLGLGLKVLGFFSFRVLVWG
jgi:hypothetical protein